MKPEDEVAVNRPGWFAIYHTVDQWWVGTDAGVTCYRTMETAKAALTLIWLMDGRKKCPWRIFRFGEKDLVMTGHYDVKLTATEALNGYERTTTEPKPNHKPPGALDAPAGPGGDVPGVCGGPPPGAPA